jgi:hypothetical protein
MTRKEAQSMSQDKIFLHMEARLAKALDETRKKYGDDVAHYVRIMISHSMDGLMGRDLEAPVHIIFCAWIETIARWNEQIDELVRK